MGDLKIKITIMDGETERKTSNIVSSAIIDVNDYQEMLELHEISMVDETIKQLLES